MGKAKPSQTREFNVGKNLFGGHNFHKMTWLFQGHNQAVDYTTLKRKR